MAAEGENGKQGKPEYRVYRSRRGPLSWFRRRDLDSLKGDRAGRRPQSRRRDPDPVPPPPVPPAVPDDRPSWKPPRRKRRWGRRIVLLLAGWALVGVLAFAISAQIQSWKLDGSARVALQGSPWLLPQAQNILVLGTDSRSPDTLEPGAAQPERCYEQQATGQPPSDGCGGARADTLMVVRAGGGQFRKLSIPRDTLAEIPGYPAQKINAAYAFGGAKLQIETVSQFLGIPIDHVVIMNFTGFEDFIDAIGGVVVDVPERLCSDISGGRANGGWTIRLKKGKNTLDGEKALAYARTRKPSPCPGSAPSAYTTGYDDLDRAAAQQSIMTGIKNRLTSPLRLPYNFIKGPIIGWTAPKAFVSDIGFLGMPQLALSSVFAGSGDTDVLEPSSFGPGGTLVVTPGERQRAAAKLEGS
jgi:LCP family protein required for cell wall assembly